LVIESNKNSNIPGKVERKSPVQSISRAAGILRCLANNIHSVKEISAFTMLSMGTVHRILKALEEEEFVIQDPVERKYYLGVFAAQLSLYQSNTHRWLIARSSNELNRIWELFNEFTALDIEVGLQTINLLTIQSKSNYSVIRPPRSFFGSESIVLLSQHPDDELEVILSHMNVRTGDGSDKDTLRRQVKQARRQRYYVSTGITEGIMAISVPIEHYLCPATLSVVGPEIRIKPIVSNVIAEMLKSSALISEKVSQSLSGS